MPSQASAIARTKPEQIDREPAAACLRPTFRAVSPPWEKSALASTVDAHATTHATVECRGSTGRPSRTYRAWLASARPALPQSSKATCVATQRESGKGRTRITDGNWPVSSGCANWMTAAVFLRSRCRPRTFILRTMQRDQDQLLRPSVGYPPPVAARGRGLSRLGVALAVF